MLKPHISLAERGDGIWRGSIAMETEEDWRRVIECGSATGARWCSRANWWE